MSRSNKLFKWAKYNADIDNKTSDSRGLAIQSPTVEEARQLLAQGVPASARPFGGLVYRQILKQLRGEQTEKETRELIVRENRRYARRQLIWLRKEPNLVWLNGPGDQSNVLESVHSVLLDSRVI